MPSLFPQRYQDFRVRLVQARIDAGITQAELAARFADYSQSDISRVERGDRRLDFAETILWLLALGVSPSDFAGSLAELFEAQRLAHGRTRKGPATVQRTSVSTVVYRDGDRTWSGRGRKPLWIRAAEAQGISIETFKVPTKKAR